MRSDALPTSASGRPYGSPEVEVGSASNSVLAEPSNSVILLTPIVDGKMVLTPAQLALLIEAMDWRRTVAPEIPRRPVAV